MIQHPKFHYYLKTILGILLLVLGGLALFNAFRAQNFSIIFWFCYLSVPLVGIGILKNNLTIIKSQLYILAIPDLIWTFDFLYWVFNQHSLFGIVDYLFVPGDILPKIVTFQHIIAIPIIFYSLILLKNKKTDSWKISVLQVTIVYLLTRFLTPLEDNINCAYTFCGNVSLNLGKWYILLWFILSFLMIYVSRRLFENSHIFFRKFLKIKN